MYNLYHQAQVPAYLISQIFVTMCPAGRARQGFSLLPPKPQPMGGGGGGGRARSLYATPPPFEF